MKRKFPLIGAYLVAVLLTCIILCTSCHGRSPWSNTYDAPEASSDSILVAQYIDRVSNPTFLNVHEVIIFKNKLIENAEIDSLITSLPEKTLTNVAGVVINKFGTATKLQIADEYRANKGVYENLPTQPTQQPIATTENNTTQMEAVPTRVEEPREATIHTDSRDTVINGKKHRIETKITTYE